MSERFGAHYQRYPRGPDGPATTSYSTHDCSCPDSRSVFDTHVSASCQLSFTYSDRLVQTADKTKTPLSPRLLR